ncbi:MAG: methyltransferase domain-containing protein [Acidimicrobiales bacterium]
MEAEQRAGTVRARSTASASVFSTLLIDAALVAVADGERASRVLDVGCGQGPYRDLLGPTTYVGVDRTHRPGGAAVLADAAALPVGPACFDGVLCTEVIEHVPDERALARELGRVAEPGAVLVLSSPFVHGLHEVPYDFRRRTSIGLVRTLEGGGCAVERVGAVGGARVVALDGALRWADGLARRGTRRAFGGSGRAFRAVERTSAALQRGLATAVLRRASARRGIDPFAPSPRLTLGYVVRARRDRGEATS